MQTQTVPKLGYSFAELELALGVSRATLYRMKARGELKIFKVGKLPRVTPEELERITRPQEQAA